MSISIAIADDQTLVREGIRSLLALKPHFNVIAEAQNGLEAIELVQLHRPQILLLDIRMPQMNGVEVLESLASATYSPAVLVLTTFDDHELVLNCIKLGAKGYLRKDVNFNDLTNAIEQLALGHTWLQPGLSDRISHNANNHLKTTETTSWLKGAVPTLTKTELQVLKLVAAGYSNNEIADAMYKSVGTIRNQVSSILAKLDARDRTRAVLKALDMEII
ncbi:response regulator transcription factor [Thalassotalea ganghwensis]